jgi:hypothetical protein
VDLREIEAALRNSAELQLRIVRDIGVFTVALFAVSRSQKGDQLDLAGTGTLVSVTDNQYILTAAHVWEEVLSKAAKLGITLIEARDHKFLMDTQTILTFGPGKPSDWNEWGPDIIFLRVPPEHAAAIKAYRSFYTLTNVDRADLNVDHLAVKVLMGAPHELGKFTQTHASIEFPGFFMQADAPCYRRGVFDYIDLEVDTSCTDVPESFGGVSGGGLWNVLVYSSSSTGKIESVEILEGVAFHQSPVENGRRIIRCHGPESIRGAMPIV